MKQRIKDKIEKRSTELLVLTAVIIVGGAVATASSSNILDAGTSSEDGLVAEYRFDTGAGNTAYDTSGNNDGTINGASWTQGAKGKALKFDGSGDYVDIPSSNSLSSLDSSITVAGWVKPNTISEDWDNIFHKRGAVFFGLDTSNGLKWGIRQDGSTFNSVTAQNVVDTNRFQHVAATFNSGNYRIYVNGRKVREGTFSSVTSIQDTSNGAEWGRQGDNRYFDGKMDEMKVYSESLNQSQIKSLYNSGAWRIGTVTSKDDPSKVAEFSFQHQNSSHVLDTSGYNNHGERMNGVGQEDAVGCKVGRCYSFDGNDDWVSVSQSQPINITGDITISAWLKHDGPNSNSNWQGIVSKGDAGSGYHLLYDESNYAFRIDGNNYASSISPTGKWEHITVVLNNSNLDFYRNGVLKDTISAEKLDSTNSNSLYIGRNGWNSDDLWNGKIDQVKIFNRSLSQAEIIEKTQKLEGGGTVLDMRFNREGGDLVQDYSGENNHGRLKPNETAGPDRVPGVTGNALEFDGSDDYVDLPIVTSNKEFSISLWFKSPITAANQEDYAKLFSGYTGSRADYYVQIRPDGELSGGFRGADGNWHEAMSGVIPRQDRWHHVILTNDGTDLKIFVNGALKDTAPGGTPVEPTDFHIGRLPSEEGYFRGRIDSVKVFPYAVSKSKIKQLYAHGASQIGEGEDSSPSTDLDKGLVLSQTFNRIETCGQSDTVSCPSGMNGEVAVDESWEANHGELVNGPTEKNAAECKVGGCLGFDGSDDYVRVSDSEVFDYDNGQGFTYSTWVEMSDSAVSDTDFETFMGKGSWSSPPAKILQVTDSNNFRFAIKDSSGSSITLDSSTTVESGKKYHVAATYNGSTARIYVNGRLEKSSSADLEDFAGSQDFYMGLHNRVGGPGKYQYWNGKIDQTKVYNRSLSKEEVWKLYTRGRDRSRGMAGPAAFWRFDQGSGQEAYDYAGGYTGILGGSMSVQSSDPERVNSTRGDALNFDGNNDYVEVQSIGQIINQNNEFSISYRIKYQNFKDYKVAYGNKANKFWTEPYRDGSSGVSIAFNDASGTFRRLESGYVLGSENKWYRITYVWDGRYLEAYVGSKKVGTLDTGGVKVDLPSTHYIGSYDGSGNFVNATMDDVRIYPYALSQEQVKKVMNGGAVRVG